MKIIITFIWKLLRLINWCMGYIPQTEEIRNAYKFFVEKQRQRQHGLCRHKLVDNPNYPYCRSRIWKCEQGSVLTQNVVFWWALVKRVNFWVSYKQETSWLIKQVINFSRKSEYNGITVVSYTLSFSCSDNDLISE